MKYVIDIPKNIIDKIRQILKKGEYESLNELIVTALENQIILEEGEKIQEDLFSTILKLPKFNQNEAFKKIEEKDFSKWISKENINGIKTYPMPEVKYLEFPNTTYNDNWLWGQINRIFPIKLGLRILGNMQKEKEDFIPLKEFLRKARYIARNIGLQLLKIDLEIKRNRDERVSTALPVGKNEEKAELRYTSHFLVNKRTDGVLDGAMARLRFVNVQSSNEKENMVGITNEGLEFVMLKNPILDNSTDSEITISDEEADFYLKHIKDNVPEERNPFACILEIIKSGSVSVIEINKEIKGIKKDWTDIVTTTQRSGALGRMNELGLLEKSKKGRRVTYRISKKGESLLDSLKHLSDFKG